MTDEIKPVSTEETKDTTVDTASNYIEAINKLKANSVDRSDYEKLKAENKQLLDSIVNGQSVETPKAPETVDVEALRKKLYDKEGSMSNLEYIETTLKLRDELIKRGERDPFLPYGQNISPTYEDTQAAERVADVFRECIEYADGDSQLFTQELQRRTNDVRIRR